MRLRQAEFPTVENLILNRRKTKTTPETREAAPPADFADKKPDFSLLCYLQIWLRSPLLIAARTGQVMADQDPPSPTPTAVTLHYGLAVLSVNESHRGRLWATDNPPRGAIFYLSLPTKVEAGE